MEDERKEIPKQLVAILRKYSATAELIYNVAHMRMYQKAFLKSNRDPALKQKHLDNAKKYEAEVDTLLDYLWPVESKGIDPQSNLFGK